MYNSTRNQRITKVFFRSYITALLIPLFFCYVIYFHCNSVMKEQLIQSNTALINQSASFLNEHHFKISNLILSVSRNEEIRNSLINPQRITPNIKYNIKNILTELKTSNNLIQDVYIYYYNSDLVISDFGSMSKQLAFDALHRGGDFSFQDWNEQMHQLANHQLQKINTLNNTQTLAYIQTLPVNNSSLSHATLVIILDESMMLNSLSTNSYFEGSKFFIYDKADNFLLSNSDSPNLDENYLKEMTDSSDIANLNINGDKVTVVYASPEDSMFQYVIMLPYDVFWHHVVYMRNLLILASIFILLSAIFLALYLSRKNYAPVQKLMSILQQKSTNRYDNTKNEYQYIEEQLDEILTANHHYHTQIETQNDIMYSYHLKNWILGETQNIESLMNQMPKNFKYKADTTCRLILFNTYEYDRLFEYDKVTDTQSQQNTLFFIIKNVYSEALESYHPLFIQLDNNVFCCITNTTVKDLNIDVIEHIHNILKTSMGIACIAYISDNYIFTDISEAYHLAFSYLYSDKDKKSAFVYTIDNNNLSYQFAIETEQKLINYIRNGDYQSTAEVITNLFVSNQSPTTDMFTLLKSNIISIYAKASTITDINTIRSIINRISAAKKPDDIKAQCLQAAEVLCTAAQSINERTYHSTQNLINYISENYSNINLDVTHIGNHFCITPHYLSKQFHEQTGIFLKDYINKVRIDASKELLTSTSMPIADIAPKVGFIDANAYIRVFKKHEGITPGKFREQNKK